MLLSKARRQEIRKIAREEYLTACRLHLSPAKDSPKVFDMAQRSTQTRLKNARSYQGMIAALLLPIAIKLAMRLLEKWIDEQLFDAATLASGYQPGEPGC
ncbi:MAG: hypothetical protein GY904_34235 [Planctomycetaceae bacterium]|nr:hypothetical protein [Planctomycetaceae bacterium]